MSKEWLRQVEKKQKALEDQGIQTNVLYDKRVSESVVDTSTILDEDEKEKVCEECGEPVTEDWHDHCPKCYSEKMRDPNTTFHDYEKGNFDDYDEKIR